MYTPFAILSTENLRHNIRIITSIARKSKVMVMLKANAYGHGIRSTALRIHEMIDYIGVARIDEALVLRKVGVKTTICIMQGVYDAESVIIAACNNFELMVHHESQIHCLNVEMQNKVNVWLKVNTGIGRIGFMPSEVMSVYSKLTELKSVGVITLISHLACADEKDHSLNTLQMTEFKQLAQHFPGPKSLANSAAIFNFPESHYDVVRPGLSVYGVSPFANTCGEDLNLKPVMTLVAKVMSVRNLPGGSTIGYGGRFVTNRDMKVATIAIGYGDGYPRTAIDGTPVLVNGKECEMIGRISMDMMTIDVSACENVKCGDLVTLWGKNLPIEKISRFTKNVAYDILTSVQLRVKFHWGP